MNFLGELKHPCRHDAQNDSEVRKITHTFSIKKLISQQPFIRFVLFCFFVLFFVFFVFPSKFDRKIFVSLKMKPFSELKMKPFSEFKKKKKKKKNNPDLS